MNNLVRILLLLFFPILISTSGCSQIIEKILELDELTQKKHSLEKEIELLKLEECKNNLKELGYPNSKENLTISEHHAMIIGYSCKEKLPAWSYHVLSPEILTGKIGRTNNFRKDENISCTVAYHSDYFEEIIVDGKKKFNGFGYDRGHLAPSADFRWSEIALSESYYYSNMTPQTPGFNRISWSDLENKIRKAIDVNPQNFYIVTGPVLLDYSGVTGGPNKIPVPKYHFKTIVHLGDKPKGIAFLIPNREVEKDLRKYVVTIDSIEKLTGLDLYPLLEKEIQDKIEAHSNYEDWYFDFKKNDALPIHPETLPKNHYNTYQAQYKVGEEVSIVGKVVDTKFHEKSKSTYLNLDRSFPNQTFTVTIWGDAFTNFSYTPHKDLKGKTIVVTGQVKLDKNKVPTINVTSEKQIKIYGEF